MVLKWTLTKPKPLKYFEQELNLNPNRYLKRFDTLIMPQLTKITMATIIYFYIIDQFYFLALPAWFCFAEK